MSGCRYDIPNPADKAILTEMIFRLKVMEVVGAIGARGARGGVVMGRYVTRVGEVPLYQFLHVGKDMRICFGWCWAQVFPKVSLKGQVKHV